MEQIFLAIIFIISNEATFLPGWHPIEMKSMSLCESRKIMLESQAQMMFKDSMIKVDGIYCGTAEEIIELLKKKTGIEV